VPFDASSPYGLVAAGITRTFQSIRLFNSLTVEEHILLARRSYCRSGRARGKGDDRDIRGVSGRLLTRVGLDHKAHLNPAELSYGERRRLEIARGLAIEPRLFLLDEPAAGSTPSEHGKLAELITEIAVSGVAIILVEHHMDLVGSVSTRVVVLNFGRVIANGTFDEIRKHPEVISVYLGVSGT
jgi:branched-chain amino acid transport system ATP-binding protein